MRLIDADELLEMIKENIEESGKHRMAVLAEEVIDVINDYAEDYEAEADYQRGLNDAWEAARKIAGSISLGGLNTHELMKLFGTSLVTEVVDMVTAEQAIETLRTYEAKKKAEEEIKVGDEVIQSFTHGKGIVVELSLEGDIVTVLEKTGHAFGTPKSNLKKTGRHFPQVAELLDAMKDERGR